MDTIVTHVASNLSCYVWLLVLKCLAVTGFSIFNATQDNLFPFVGPGAWHLVIVYLYKRFLDLFGCAIFAALWEHTSSSNEGC